MYVLTSRAQDALFCLHPHQYLLSLVFLVIAIQIGMRCYLGEVLVCISVIISNVEQLFMYHLLVICESSLRNCLFWSLAFLNWIICFFAVKLYESLIYFGVLSRSSD